MHLIAVPQAISKALTTTATRRPNVIIFFLALTSINLFKLLPYESDSHTSGTVKTTYVIVPQFPNRAMVVAFHEGNAIKDDSVMGPQVFQTVH